MSLKFWTDPISEPCRTVKYALLRLGVEHEEKFTAVFKDTRTDDFKKNVNPRGLVPTVHHDDVQLCESATAVRYLLDYYEGDEELLPRSCPKMRAKVDYWLDWNDTTARPALIPAVFKIKFGPAVMGAPEPSDEEKEIL